MLFLGRRARCDFICSLAWSSVYFLHDLLPTFILLTEVEFSTLNKKCFEPMLMSHLVVHLLVSSSSRRFPSTAPGCSGPAVQCQDLAKGQKIPPTVKFHQDAEDFLDSEHEAGCGGSGPPQTVQPARQSLVLRHWGYVVFSSCRRGIEVCSGLVSVEALSPSPGRSSVWIGFIYPDPAALP